MQFVAVRGGNRMHSTRKNDHPVNSPPLTFNSFQEISYETTSSFKTSNDLLVVPMFKPNTTSSDFANQLKKNIPAIQDSFLSVINAAIDSNQFNASSNSKYFARVFDQSSNSFKHIGLIGMGTIADNDKSVDISVFHGFGRALASFTKEANSKSVSIAFPSPFFANKLHLQNAILGFYDSLYQDKRFNKVTEASKEIKPVNVERIACVGVNDEDQENILESIRKASAIASSVDYAKDLVGEYTEL
jgi:leucyl aminopeptidase